MKMGVILLFLFSHVAFADDCGGWSLPLSNLSIDNISQQDSGMCHAFRDSKALEYFHDSVGIGIKESSVLEVGTIFHRKMLFLKQLIKKMEFSADYQKGESILDWGNTCDAVNNILKNGLCQKNAYTSSSFHFIYNLFRNLVGVSLKECDSCDNSIFSLTNEQKRQWSNTLSIATIDYINNDKGISKEEKDELVDFVKNALSTKKKINYAKLVKVMERKVNRSCKKRKEIKVYEKYECVNEFLPDIVDRDLYGQEALKYLKKYISNRSEQAVMAGICSAKLSSTKDPKNFKWFDGVGSMNCGSHAVLIVGQQKASDGSCQLLIEDNYPEKCIQEKMPWADCEFSADSTPTGRYWIDRERFAPILFSIGKISKKSTNN